MSRCCPECGKALHGTGSGPGWMNSEQWDAVKAGDYFAECESAKHPNGNCYFWRTDDGGVRKAQGPLPTGTLPKE